MESDLLPLFQDDSTSCSSSPLGEDADDLHLGAEANMFSPKQKVYDNQGKRKPVHKFVIAKEITTTDRRDGLDYTYSTISSISDLIDAREGDPDEMLFRLGFASFEGEESHSSILARFTSPLGHQGCDDRTHDQQMSQIPKGAHVGSIVQDGIVKTQEWLSRQEDVNNPSQPLPIVAKDGTGSGGGKMGNQTSLGQSKKQLLQKKRLKWSKSRQSSFEHLLPNLEEEELAPTENPSSGLNNSQHAHPIRESSQEGDDIANLDREIIEARSSSTPISEKLSNCEVLEESMPFDRGCSGRKHSVAPVKVGIEGSLNPVFNVMPLSEEMVQVSYDETTLSARLLPWKRSNLLTMKVDSFELEEIVSNDGRASPNLLRTIKRCANAATTKPIRDARNEAEGDNDSAVDHASGNRSSPSLASESSSGFHDGTEDLTLPVQRRDSVGSTDGATLSESHQSVLSGVTYPCVCPIPFGLDDNSWQKLTGFCTVHSLTARAGAVADYALFGNNERRKPQAPGICICTRRSKSTSWLSTPRVGHRAMCSRRCVSCPCILHGEGISRWQGVCDQRLWSGDDVSPSDFFKRRGRRRLETVYQSCPDGVNVEKNASIVTDAFGLYRSASMPALTAFVPSASSLRCDISCWKSCVNVNDGSLISKASSFSALPPRAFRIDVKVEARPDGAKSCLPPLNSSETFSGGGTNLPRSDPRSDD